MAAEYLTGPATISLASVAFSASEDTPIIVTYNSEGTSETNAQVTFPVGTYGYPSVQFYFRCLAAGGTVLASSAVGLQTYGADTVVHTIAAVRAVTQKMVAPSGTTSVDLAVSVSAPGYWPSWATVFYRNYPPRSITVLGTKR